eukprot:2492523-Amphidinium_carterae.1
MALSLRRSYTASLLSLTMCATYEVPSKLKILYRDIIETVLWLMKTVVIILHSSTGKLCSCQSDAHQYPRQVSLNFVGSSSSCDHKGASSVEQTHLFLPGCRNTTQGDQKMAQKAN